MAKHSPYNETVFKAVLLEQYQGHCRINKLPESNDGFLTYLIEHNFIGIATINQFATLKEFQRLYPENNHNRTRTIQAISINSGIGETRIFTILKDHVFKFRKRRIKK